MKKILILLTPVEIQSKLDRIKFAELLIQQLPSIHDGRNTWLLNYGNCEEAQELRRQYSNGKNPMPYFSPGYEYIEIDDDVRSSKPSIKNILEKANQIVNQRSEEQDRQYGEFSKSMTIMAEIFNAMTGLELAPVYMYYAMIALKLSRERHAHKKDNLLDAVAYLGALDNFIDEQIERRES